MLVVAGTSTRSVYPPGRGPHVNKADLITELADRMGGDHQLATEALENTLDIIVRAVASGESITIMGFRIFEKRARAARVARNPHTGESIPVPPTYSPAFRPGQYFKSVVQGTETLPEGRLAAKRSSSHQAFGGLRANGVDHRENVVGSAVAGSAQR